MTSVTWKKLLSVFKDHGLIFNLVLNPVRHGCVIDKKYTSYSSSSSAVSVGTHCLSVLCVLKMSFALVEWRKKMDN